MTLVVTEVDGSRGAVGHLPVGEDEAMTIMERLLVLRLRVVGEKTTGRPLNSRTNRCDRAKSSVFLAQTQHSHSHFLETERGIFYPASVGR